MIKRIFILITALALLLSATGCSFIGGEISDLFQPPRLGDEEQSVLDALQTVAGNDYTLKLPHSGTNRSSIVFSDIDGDTINEAIAFFTPGGMATVQLQFFDYVNEAWVPSAAINGDSSEIYSYEFIDLFGDGHSELVVGWDISISSSATETQALPSRGLSIYGDSDGKIKQIYSIPYSYMLKVNLNSDLAEEIAIVTSEKVIEGESASVSTKISIIENKNGVISADRSAPLFSGVTAYTSIISGKSGDESPAIFLDAKLSSEEYITEIVRYDGDSLKCLMPAFEENPSKRTSSITCMDIDQDTIIEFPICNPLPDYDVNSTNVRYRTDWCTVENGTLTTTLSSVISLTYGFYITIYEENRNRVTVEFNPDRALYTVRIADGHLTGNILFTVKRFAESESANVDTEGYTRLFATNGYIVAAKTENPMLFGREITMNEISETVHPITVS